MNSGNNRWQGAGRWRNEAAKWRNGAAKWSGDRLERILTRALSGQRGGQGEDGQRQGTADQAGTSGNEVVLEERVNGLETKVDGIKSTLDRLVLLIEEGPQ
jgi:hypothetical protein